MSSSEKQKQSVIRFRAELKRCMSNERRWNRNEVSRESPNKEVNRRPTLLKKFRADYYFFYFKNTPGSIITALVLSQGPLPETVGDFWRAVWEQHVPSVVMMTKLEERNRVSACCLLGGSVAEWLACWTQAQKGPGSNRSRDPAR